MTPVESAPGGQDSDGGLVHVVDDLACLGEIQERVSLEDIQHALGERGFGPFLLVPALIELSPVGGIPGLPTALALLVALCAVQLLVGRRHFWLPRFVNARSIRGERLSKAMKRVRGGARSIDKVVHPRLHWATREPFIHIAALLCLGLTVTVPPLELMPFASSAPFATIGLFGLGLMVRDGLLVLLASLASVGAFYVAYTTLF